MNPPSSPEKRTAFVSHFELMSQPRSMTPIASIRCAIASVATACLIGLTGCEPPPQEVTLDAASVSSYELADESAGRFDWPVSRSGFAVTRPPIYSSLIGLRDQPLDPLDQADPEPAETLTGDDWAKFLRAIGTHAQTPFQCQPIHQDIGTFPLKNPDAGFTFSPDGDSLFLADAGKVRSIILSDAWKDEVPLMASAGNPKSSDRWNWKLPSDFGGGPFRLIVTSPSASLPDPVEDDAEGDETDSDSNQSKARTPTLLVIGKNQTARLNINDGTLLARFPTPEGGLDCVSPASDCGEVVAATPTGDVYWLNDESTKWTAVGTTVRPTTDFDGRQCLSIAPSGGAFLAMDENNATTVWMSDGRKTVSSQSTTSLDPDVSTIVWADNCRIWCDKKQLHYDSFETDEGDAVSLYAIEKIIWRPVSMWPQRAKAYSPLSGMTVLGLRRLRDGRAMWSLWDMNSDAGGYSCATDLFDDATLAASTLPNQRLPQISVSLDASRVAYLDPESKSLSLRVFYRSPWERTDSQESENWVTARLLADDESELAEIDRAAATIRSLPLDLYWSRPPEELGSKCIFRTTASVLTKYRKETEQWRFYLDNLKLAREQGDEASEQLFTRIWEEDRDIGQWDDERYQAKIDDVLKTIKKYDDLFEKLDRWRASGSVVAELAYASDMMKVAWAARGNGMANTITEDGWKVFTEKSRECETACRRLLKKPHPPMQAFLQLFSASKGTDATHESVEPDVRRCNRLYPECSSIHTTLGFWLLPRWGGKVGDSASYMQAAVANADPSLREKIFGISAIRMADDYRGNQNYFHSTGMNEKRAFRGTMKVLDEEAMGNIHFVNPLVWVASYSQNQQVANDANEYIRENFAYLAGSVHKQFPSLFAHVYDDRPQPR